MVRDLKSKSSHFPNRRLGSHIRKNPVCNNITQQIEGVSHLDDFIGVHDDGDEEGDDDINEERDEHVDVDGAEHLDRVVVVVDGEEGGEHVVAVQQREQRLRRLAQRAELQQFHTVSME